MNFTRRGFLKALGTALAAGFVVDPVVDLLVPEPKKIWVVGAQLTSARDLAKPANFGLGYAEHHLIISEYINSPEGRAQLAASMIQPLRLHRDYAGIARKIFTVEQLPDGAWPIYSKGA